MCVSVTRVCVLPVRAYVSTTQPTHNWLTDRHAHTRAMNITALPTRILDFCVASFLDTKDLRQATNACKTLHHLLKQALFERRIEWLHDTHVPLHPIIKWKPRPTRTKATRVRTNHVFPLSSHVRSVHMHHTHADFEWLTSSAIRFLYCGFDGVADGQTVKFPSSLRGLIISLSSIPFMPSIVFPRALKYLSILDSPLALLAYEGLHGSPFPGGLQRLQLEAGEIRLHGACLPPGLKHLHLKIWDKCHIHDVTLPEGLHTFTLFKMRLCPRFPKLPKTLKRLWIYSLSLYTNDLTLPEGLRELRIDSANMNEWMRLQLPASLEHLILGSSIKGDLGGLTPPAGLKRLTVGYNPASGFYDAIGSDGLRYVFMHFDRNRMVGDPTRDLVICPKECVFMEERNEAHKQAADETGTYRPRQILGCRTWAIGLEERVNAKRAAGLAPLKMTFRDEMDLGSWQWEHTFEHQALFCE